MGRKALGRGLDALIPNAREVLTGVPGASASPSVEAATATPPVPQAPQAPEAPKSPESLQAPQTQHTPQTTAGVADGLHYSADGLQYPSVVPSVVPSAAGPAGASRPLGPETDGRQGYPLASSQALGSPQALAARQALASGRASTVIDIGLDRIKPNPYQPRSSFDEAETEELAASIRSKGVLQPVLVRRKGTGYELIAGERRMRAARRAGLSSVPAIVRDVADRELLEIALIENEQRVDLNPIESARSYERIIGEFQLSQTELADVLGRDRSTVSNLLRLLRLPEKVQKLVQERALSMGHARALAGIEDPKRCQVLAERVARSGMPVRALERLVQAGSRPRTTRRVTLPAEDPELSPFIERLRHRFATQVFIHRRNGSGKIEIEFYNQDDLERILEALAVLRDG